MSCFDDCVWLDIPPIAVRLSPGPDPVINRRRDSWPFVIFDPETASLCHPVPDNLHYLLRVIGYLKTACTYPHPETWFWHVSPDQSRNAPHSLFWRSLLIFLTFPESLTMTPQFLGSSQLPRYALAQTQAVWPSHFSHALAVCITDQLL